MTDENFMERRESLDGLEAKKLEAKKIESLGCIERL
jgi:hypothetical protein